MSPSEFLARHGAPRSYVNWAATLGSLTDAWTVCPDVDWMIWTVGCLDDLRCGDFDAALRGYAVACVGRIGALLLDPRSRRALELASARAAADARLAAWQDARDAVNELTASPDWCASISLGATAAMHLLRPRGIDAALDAPWCARQAVAWHPTEEATAEHEAQWQLAHARGCFDASVRPLLASLR